MIRSLYFHNPSEVGFEKLIKRLVQKEYHFLSIEELFDYISNKEKSKDNLAYISFDDGWQGNLKILPIIDKYHIPITIFVATEPILSGNFWWEFVAKKYGYKQMFEFKKLPYQEFYKQLAQIKKEVGSIQRSAMTLDELKQMAQHPLVSIQSHTVNHPILTHVPDDILEQELIESKKQLEEIIQKEVFAFSYPNGSLSQREIDAARKHYKMAFTTEQNNISFKDDLLLLPRYALTGDYHRDLLKMYGFWKHLKSIKQKLTFR